MEDALERRESRSIASPSADLQAGGAVAGIDVHSVSPEVAIQVVLADLLEEPGRELVSWIQQRFPGRDLNKPDVIPPFRNGSQYFSIWR